MSASVDMGGFFKGINEARRRALEAGRQAVNRSGEHILGQSQKICPVSPTDPANPHYTGTSGTLQNSATGLPATVNGTSITKIVGYNIDYAAAVHESLTANHKYPGSGNPLRQSKYLEFALRQGQQRFITYVQDAMRKAF